MDGMNNTTDVKTILVNQHLSKRERIQEFIEQISNPYQFRCGDVTVSTKFNDSQNSTTLLECMRNLIV